MQAAASVFLTLYLGVFLFIFIGNIYWYINFIGYIYW